MLSKQLLSARRAAISPVDLTSQSRCHSSRHISYHDLPCKLLAFAEARASPVGRKVHSRVRTFSYPQSPVSFSTRLAEPYRVVVVWFVRVSKSRSECPRRRR